MNPNFDLTNTPDDVYLNVLGKKKKRKIAAQKAAIKADIDAKMAAAKAAAKASESAAAEPAPVVTPADTASNNNTADSSSDTILGMPKMVFYGVAGLLVAGAAFFAYKKFKK